MILSAFRVFPVFRGLSLSEDSSQPANNFHYCSAEGSFSLRFSALLPGPVPSNELRGRAVVKWLAVKERLRLPVRQLLGQCPRLISRQWGGARCGPAASQQRQGEED